MRRTKDQILESARSLIGERDDDEALNFLSDLTDTVDEDNEDWHSRYDELDKSWRAKYKERFFTGAKDEKLPEEEPAPEEPKTSYADLFTYN